MRDNDHYVPMHELIYDKETPWVFTTLNMTYADIAGQGIVVWCHENMQSRWTMMGGNRFGFESGEDALIFKMQFGIK